MKKIISLIFLFFLIQSSSVYSETAADVLKQYGLPNNLKNNPTISHAQKRHELPNIIAPLQYKKPTADTILKQKHGLLNNNLKTPNTISSSPHKQYASIEQPKPQIKPEVFAKYTYGANDKPISMTTEEGTFYYMYDGMGSVTALTNEKGMVVVRYKLDPWGKIISQTGDSFNRQIYTGQEHDTKTGLIYYGARYYDVHSAHKIETNGYFFAADGVMFSFMPTVKQGIFAAYKLGGDPVIKKCYGFCSKADLQIKGL